MRFSFFSLLVFCLLKCFLFSFPFSFSFPSVHLKHCFYCIFSLFFLIFLTVHVIHVTRDKITKQTSFSIGRLLIFSNKSTWIFVYSIIFFSVMIFLTEAVAWCSFWFFWFNRNKLFFTGVALIEKIPFTDVHYFEKPIWVMPFIQHQKSYFNRWSWW